MNENLIKIGETFSLILTFRLCACFFLDRLQSEFTEKEAKLRVDFETKLDEIKRKSADDLHMCKTEMVAKLKREYGMCMQISCHNQFYS